MESEVNNMQISKERDKRYAYEWFMRAEDKRYWRMAEDLINKKIKKVAVFTAINTAISTGITFILFFSLLHKSQ
ncbi:hypothetical protein [Enterocloster citroniae]|uniref:hypothetical protein n=1 Tax=Enterocloster citroniae TaxID=358743 RepID=UPI00189943FA|nr:hypothetical protein [Enterocloster citroniae]